MTIANPIYDVVFKYLMEDERIARTILSALLKKDVVKVEMRPHEYSNGERDTLSVFRIDFGATVRDEDGSKHLILIELQKTWLETETLRFRQYLGVHYSNPKNITPSGNALPMVAVYLLGHRVGSISEPVLYVSHQSRDYDGKVVTQGLPDPFVESLTHDSIIVQIPLLKGQINNRLDKVLSVFDQTRRDRDDGRMLRIDEAQYDGDAEMGLILHRLTMAAASAEMRHHMNVEDEYFSVIEKRDTEVLQARKTIAEQKDELAKQGKRLAKQDEKLAEQDEKLAEQDEKLAEQDEKLAEQDEMLQKSVALLLKSGLSIHEIADALGVDIETVKRLSKQ